jgi:hypothetical protein
VVSGARQFVREIRVPEPAGVTAIDILVSPDAQSYGYTRQLRLANLFVVEGLR